MAAYSMPKNTDINSNNNNGEDNSPTNAVCTTLTDEEIAPLIQEVVDIWVGGNM